METSEDVIYKDLVKILEVSKKLTRWRKSCAIAYENGLKRTFSRSHEIKATKRQVKGTERVPYGPKINGNLIRCHLQGFGKNPEGFEKLTRVAKIVCYSSRKWPETDVFAKS
jgi:hypothetical protein